MTSSRPSETDTGVLLRDQSLRRSVELLNYNLRWIHILCRLDDDTQIWNQPDKIIVSENTKYIFEKTRRKADYSLVTRIGHWIQLMVATHFAYISEDKLLATIDHRPIEWVRTQQYYKWVAPWSAWLCKWSASTKAPFSSLAINVWVSIS